MCGPSGSLSRDFSVFYSAQSNCDGSPVVNQRKEVDVCGVCGGDGKSCLDCQGNVNGSKGESEISQVAITQAVL